jgi:hypothetical protein
MFQVAFAVFALLAASIHLAFSPRRRSRIFAAACKARSYPRAAFTAASKTRAPLLCANPKNKPQISTGT